MSHTVLESILDTLKPRKKKLVTKKNVVMALSLATKLIGISLLKTPALAPVYNILDELLKPAANDNSEKSQWVLMRIKKLKTKLATVSDVEQRKVKEQIDALYDLFSDDEA